MSVLSIERRELTSQFLFVRAKVARSEISKAIGDGLGKTFPYAIQAGVPISGRPTARCRRILRFGFEIGVREARLFVLCRSRRRSVGF